MILNDIASSTKEISLSSPAVKPTLPKVRPHSHSWRGYSLQHLKLEEKALEKDVSTLSNKRGELTEELESLLTQVCVCVCECVHVWECVCECVC